MRQLTLIAAPLLISAVALAGPDIFEGAPAAPPGYETHLLAQGAVLSGKIEAVKEPESVPDTVTFYDDVEYANRDGLSLSIDVFVPKGTTKPTTTLVFIHGGGWSGGNKEDYLYYNLKMAELGYVSASVRYRLSQEAKFPAAVQDVNCAIAFLRKNAETYHIDPENMIAIGGSAGGHLSLMAGYSQDPALECPEGGDSSVQGVINFYGVVDCTVPVAIEAPQVNNFIGASYEDAPDKYKQNSPLFHLDANDPITLTFHGTIDELVPIAQADVLHDKLDELGITNYYDRIDGWPHSMDVAKPINDRACYIIEKFLAKHFPMPEKQ
jgi:acetyl esterase/lipase